MQASRLTTTYSETRRRVYALLLRCPERTWTVREVATALGSGPISIDAVRSTLYLLHADGCVDAVAGHRALTWRLSAYGAATLAAIMEAWRSSVVNDI